MTDGPWRLDYSTGARHDLRRLNPAVRTRVVAALEQMVGSAGDTPAVRKLTGSGELRLRVGDWRVRFVRDHENRVISVTRVLPRGRAYDR